VNWSATSVTASPGSDTLGAQGIENYSGGLSHTGACCSLPLLHEMSEMEFSPQRKRHPSCSRALGLSPKPSVTDGTSSFETLIPSL